MARFERIDTKLGGPVLLQPAVFPDERGFFAETFREASWPSTGSPTLGPGQPLALARAGRSAGMHFQIGDGVAKLVRCGRGTDRRRARRPAPRLAARTASGRPTSSTTRRCASSTCPSASPTASRVLSDIADVLYKQTAYYSGEVERGIAYDDPAVGMRWPVPDAERVVSERDRTAPSLKDFESQLPDW